MTTKTTLEERIAKIRNKLHAKQFVPEFYREGSSYSEGDFVLEDNEVYRALFQNSEHPAHSNNWLKKNEYESKFLIEAAYLGEAFKIIKELQEIIEMQRKGIKEASMLRDRSKGG